MKIQFIVCGWWYDEWDGKKNQTEFIDALYELKEENENLAVMWTCQKTPPKNPTAVRQSQGGNVTTMDLKKIMHCTKVGNILYFWTYANNKTKKSISIITKRTFKYLSERDFSFFR